MAILAFSEIWEILLVEGKEDETLWVFEALWDSI